MDALPQNIERIQEILRPLRLDDAVYQEVMRKMDAQMTAGLGAETNAAADLKMYVTYVRSVPDGTEVGNFLALDLGGTNFRVLLIQLAGEKVSMQSTIYSVPEEIMLGTGEALFDHIAGCIQSFVTDQGLGSIDLPLGFTFSFPCKQEGLARARLVTWTKGFKCSGVEGEDIVRLLNEAVARRGMKVRCVAVINDTVGALMSCAHDDRTCRIGLILGTGTNACYLEDLGKVKLWDGDETPRQVIINTEWGAFGNNGDLDFLKTEYDRNVDAVSINPGKQIYEKMISGMYMGEIARQVIMQLVQAGCLFQGVALGRLAEPMMFLTKYISEIETDQEFDNYVKTRHVLQELRISNYRLADCIVLQEVCRVVSSRAARLAAAGVAVLLNRTGQDHTTVAVDGSLYRFHPFFHDMMTEMVHRLTPTKPFKLLLSQDGSGKGAALVAAVSCRLLTADAIET